MKNYDIACIPGDGIGQEVIPACRSVLQALASGEGFTLRFHDFPWGADHFRRHGCMMPADGLAALRTSPTT
jgi:tartrate dehydrogenase/decarboxylase / D-malate dehydrogenase